MGHLREAVDPVVGDLHDAQDPILRTHDVETGEGGEEVGVTGVRGTDEAEVLHKSRG
jgi:hypothetical protein